MHKEGEGNGTEYRRRWGEALSDGCRLSGLGRHASQNSGWQNWAGWLGSGHLNLSSTLYGLFLDPHFMPTACLIVKIPTPLRIVSCPARLIRLTS